MSKEVTKLLTREDILQASDLPTERVSVPEWSGTVIVKGLNGTQKNAYEESMISQKGKNVSMNMKNATAKLVAVTVVDDEGNQTFQPSDVEALGAKSGRALNRVYEKAAELSGLSDKDMDELTKNSESIPEDSSTSN